MPTSPPRKLPLRRLLLTALFLLVGLFTYRYLVRPPLLEVKLYTVTRGDVEATVSNTRAGTVKACRRAKLAPPAGGQIAELRVKKGQRVKKGDVLLELWHEDMHAQKRLAQDQLQSAKIHVREACTLAESARREAERALELRQQAFISQQQLERSQTEAEARQAACDAARNDVKQAEARIEVADANHERMLLRAPFAGIIADINGELGEYATPSPPGILTLPAVDLIDDSCLYVSAPIDEVDAGKLKVGQPSRITLDALKDRHFSGTLRRIAPYVLDVEKQARTVEVEVEFMPLPRDEQLLVGYSADVEIIHDRHAQVLRVPAQSLLGGDRVLLLNPDGILEERRLVLGLSNWEYVEVLNGLEEGDRIVATLDQPGVKAGLRARPQASAP